MKDTIISSFDLMKFTINELNYLTTFETTYNNQLLLTGASGFLGVHLLDRLIALNLFDKIHIIIRNKQKLLNQLNYYKLSIDLTKINIIEGDLNSLDTCLFPNVQYVIHSAAQIHNLKSLQQLYNDNVLTTKKISQLYKNNRVYFISSLSVFVSSNLKGIHTQKTLDVNQDYYLYGGYAQSKFVGEKIIQQIYKHKIYRLGLLTGHTDNCIFPKDFFTLFVSLLKKINTYPKNYEESFVDITPVNFATDLIINNLFNKNNIIHIANKKSVSINHFIKLLDIKPIDNEKWINLIRHLSSVEQMLLKFAFFKTEMLNNQHSFFNLDLFQSTNHYYNIDDYFLINNEIIMNNYIKNS